MAKFRKKPVVIEAWQYTGNNSYLFQSLSDNIKESPVLEPAENNPTGEYLQISTLEGVMIAIVGDWIIKGVNGEFYPCKPDIFEKTYEPVETEKYINIQDQDSHWYYIPKSMKEDFLKMEEEGEKDEWEEFNEKYSDYRTGGGPHED